MYDQSRQGLSYKVVEDKQPDVVIDSEEADADIGYFELKLEEFKSYFSDNYIQNRLSKTQIKHNPRDDFTRISTMIKIYEFILGKNKEMLKAINKERGRNDEYKKQLPILIDRLQHLSEACIKKEELIKTQGEYMQQSESQIYELQVEVREKEILVRELNNTILEQREYLDSKYTNDNSMSMASFDSKMDNSNVRRKKKNYKDDVNTQSEADADTIEGLKEDIKQLLKEYKLIERQKDDTERKYQDVLVRNEDLVNEVMNMEEIITDQDTQIKNMREKLQSQIHEIKTHEIIGKQMNIINSRLNPAFDDFDNELNKSANISRQINLENFKEGRIGNRQPKTAQK